MVEVRLSGVPKVLVLVSLVQIHANKVLKYGVVKSINNNNFEYNKKQYSI